MSSALLEKYRVNISHLFQIPQKIKKGKTFYDIAKKHIVKSEGSKENIALNIDTILYGK
ncbi:MAG: hypothetical protein WCJ84_01935 [Candidatus Peregrinibacteria bacterium]